MIRAIHRRLRLIEYYSASRRRTAWTRALDAALVASLLLAMPAAWVATVAVDRPGDARTVSGLLGRTAGGAVGAVINDPDGPALAAPGDPLGSFSLTRSTRRRGWPLTTVVETAPVEVVIDVYEEPAIRRNPDLGADDPIRRAIEAELARRGDAEMLDAWREGPPPPRRRPAAWLAAGVAWWVILWAGLSIAVHLLAFAWRLHRGRGAAARARRAAAGRCPHCGYDVRGLEFRERCPECGEIME